MFVKPADGRSVPDPAKRDTLPADGRDVPDTPYWHRRRTDGDVVVVPTTPKPTKARKEA